MEREAMEFDAVIVGGGPAGLASLVLFAWNVVVRRCRVSRRRDRRRGDGLAGECGVDGDLHRGPLLREIGRRNLDAIHEEGRRGLDTDLTGIGADVIDALDVLLVGEAAVDLRAAELEFFAERFERGDGLPFCEAITMSRWRAKASSSTAK